MEEKKKIIVHEDLCIGCGTCEGVAPEYFELAKDGLSHVKKQYDEKDKDIIEEAKKSCPVEAIEIITGE